MRGRWVGAALAVATPAAALGVVGVASPAQAATPCEQTNWAPNGATFLGATWYSDWRTQSFSNTDKRQWQERMINSGSNVKRQLSNCEWQVGYPVGIQIKYRDCGPAGAPCGYGAWVNQDGYIMPQSQEKAGAPYVLDGVSFYTTNEPF